MKIKLFVTMIFLSLAIACGPKFNSDAAAAAVKTAFNLTEKEKVDILGISKETSDIILVKFRINGNDINSKMRKYDTGWQLDEVQNMIGEWIPAGTVRSQFDPTEKVKTAMTDINLIATALVDYIIDHGSFTFSDTPYLTEYSDTYKALCPWYVKSLPTNDPWGKPYNVLCGKIIDGSLYGIPKGGDHDFIVFSFGRDGKMEKWTFDSNVEKAGLHSDNDPDKDIINYGGTYIRSPKSLVRQIY